MSEQEEVVEFPPEAYEGDAEERDLGPVTPVLLEIYHPKDEKQEYVIRVSDPESGELHGTLFAKEEHTASAFGNFIEYHLKAKGI